MADQDIHQRLINARKNPNLSLHPTPTLMAAVAGGEAKPFTLKPHQCIAAYHLVLQGKMVLGDCCGSGKTLGCIAALCYVWDKYDPTHKVIVLCPKSAILQWKGEVDRFTTGVKVYVASGPKRDKAYEAFFKAPTTEKSLLIVGYASVARDWGRGAGSAKVNGKTVATVGYLEGLVREATATHPITVVLDEVTACKNPTTKTHEVCKQLAFYAKRAYGLTATLLKNSLIEGFGIYRTILPTLFGTKTAFMNEYCVTREMRVGNRRVPLIVGYKNLERFRQVIDPYFLGRRKEDISKDLPVLTSRDIEVTLDTEEASKYEEALTGVLELLSGDTKDYEETKAMTSLLYCQQIANSLALIDSDPTKSGAPTSSKEQALVDLLTEDLDGEKVIVYTRFEKGIARMIEILKKNGVKATRITGKEKDSDRQKNRLAFTEGDAQVIFITDAATEAVNLQAAVAMVFYDSPWSWGGFVQTIGRMVRIGSPHRGVVAYHLIASLPGKKNKTIDHYVIQTLRKKKDLIDKVIGEAAVGALQFEGKLQAVHDLMEQMKHDR